MGKHVMSADAQADLSRRWVDMSGDTFLRLRLIIPRFCSHSSSL